jgi:hypothetical protein
MTRVRDGEEAKPETVESAFPDLTDIVKAHSGIPSLKRYK